MLNNARANQPQAWRELHAIYGPQVYGWCRRAGVSEHDAADVVQDVFRNVLIGLEQFRHQQPNDSFRAWIRTIAINKVRDYFRLRSHGPQATGGSAVRSFLEQVPDPITNDSDISNDEAEKEKAVIARRVMDLIQTEFAETTWRAFWLATVEGRPSSHIADELKISEGAVRQAKYRVLKRLREAMQQYA